MTRNREYYDKTVILQLDFMNNHFLEFLKKNLNAYNMLCNVSYKGRLYLEQIQTGLLYIFENVNALKEIHKPLSPFLRRMLKNKRLTKKDKEDYLPYFNMEELFKDGKLVFNIRVVEPIDIPEVVNDQVFPILRDFYESVHENITVELKEKNTISICFNSKEAFEQYIYLTYLVLSRFLKKVGKAEKD